MSHLLKQFLGFMVVGVLAFGIDYGLLFILTEYAEMHYLVSASISFTTATVFNYICSMKYVFSGRQDMSKIMRFTIFMILSLAGLGLNNILLRWCVEHLMVHYMAAKVFATLIVSLYNFTTRKLFLEGHEWRLHKWHTKKSVA